MVEITKVDRASAPKLVGVDSEAKRIKTIKQHEYAHEEISKKKFDNAPKNDVHYKLSRGTTFSDVISDSDWNKIFRKGR